MFDIEKNIEIPWEPNERRAYVYLLMSQLLINLQLKNYFHYTCAYFFLLFNAFIGINQCTVVTFQSQAIYSYGDLMFICLYVQ